MTEILVADIGGTNARFAVAEVEGGAVRGLSDVAVLRTAEFDGLEAAWRAFVEGRGKPPPPRAAVAIAAPIGDEIRLTNGQWVVRPAAVREQLAPEALTFINDFAALSHAVDQLGPEHLRHVCGPDEPLPGDGAITVIGPGTGLGVGLLYRDGGRVAIVPTEGGHIDFAPLDEVEDYLLDALRVRYGRVSVERIVSGPGLSNLYRALAALENRAAEPLDDKALWGRALSGEDPLAAAALDRFCLAFGSVAGDLALAHGAVGVAVAGGVAARLGDRLNRSGFSDRFAAKGRYAARMMGIPVRMIVHPQPGLFGAAAAYAQEHAR